MYFYTGRLGRIRCFWRRVCKLPSYVDSQTYVRPAVVFLRRLRKAFFGVTLLLLLGGAANVKYGRRSRFEIFIFYVVCVSRSRIGLDVIYVHVESNEDLRRDFEDAHWDYAGSTIIKIKHAHIISI